MGLAVLTWWALESGGVAIIETRGAGGEVRRTHVWFVEHGDEFWLEAGAPDNGWFVDVQQRPEVTVEIDGVRVPGRAEPVYEQGARGWVRILMRRKYGVRDRWVSVFVDPDASTPVRFHLAAGATGPHDAGPPGAAAPVPGG